MDKSLKLYQNAGVHHLLHRPRSGLFFEPGLGKTITFMTYLKVLQDITSTAGYKPRALVIAPINACHLVWAKEAQKWSHTKHLKVEVLRDENREAVFESDADIHAIDFYQPNLKWLFKLMAKHKRCPWDVLCIDESTKFKNWKAARFKTLKALLPLFKRRHIMTGTPSPNGLIDLYAQMFVLDEGATLGELPSHYTGKYFFYSKDFHKYMIKEGVEKIIHKKIAPGVLTMKAIDHLDLPEMHYNHIPVQLPDDAMSVYRTMQSQFFLELGKKKKEKDIVDIEASTAGHKYNLCWQIASGSMYVPYPKKDEDGEIIPETVIDYSDIEANYPLVDDHPMMPAYRPHFVIHHAKLDAMGDLIESLQGKPLMLAYMFNHEQRAILERLEGNGIRWDEIGIVGAGEQKHDIFDALERWNNRELKILLCQPASVSHGLNLQAGGNDILWYSQTDNFEEYEQFNKRLHRQGVVGSVRIHHLYAMNTVEEAKMFRMQQKDQAQRSLKDSLIHYKRMHSNANK